MILNTDKTGSIEQFAHNLYAVAHDDRVKSLMILACDKNGFTPAEVDPILRQVPKPLFGGIFPEVICQRENCSQGSIVAGLFGEACIKIVPGLSDPNAAYDTCIERDAVPPDVRTMLVLVDGLSTRISDLINDMFTVFGLDFNYIGGGAGSLSFVQKPCLFTNDGLIQDSAVLAAMPSPSGVGVSHGWKDVEGPFCVTESSRNVIHTLDWRPAFQVYKEVVERHSGRQFAAESFFDLAKSYPFGIHKLGSEKIVRDPVVKGDDDSLTCVGEVPQRSFVHILTGDVDSLVSAAHKALTLGKGSLPEPSENETLILMDCISRVLFLGNDFSRELEAVCPDETPLIGALTIGEIANCGRDYLEFYNKTSVVGVLAEPCSR